jgi:NADPH2:quinone reductase
LIVSYGNADVPVTGVALGQLGAKGSLFATRPALFDYYAEPAERAAGAEKVWHMLASGNLKVTVGQTWPLTEAAAAHRALESRETTGSSLLIP